MTSDAPSPAWDVGYAEWRGRALRGDGEFEVAQFTICGDEAGVLVRDRSTGRTVVFKAHEMTVALWNACGFKFTLEPTDAP